MDGLSDNRLMLRVKAGDLDQLGLLFERYHQPLFGFLEQGRRNAALRKDLAKDVFLPVVA